MTTAVSAPRKPGTPSGAPRGRTTITSRAVRRVVSAVTADALEVPAGDVSVTLTDAGGKLTVEARTSIRVPALSDRPVREGTLVERLTTAQTQIRERVLGLTGSTVGRVDLRITGARIQERRRVS
ncbi:hypothetical protein C5B94_13950 [Clavibacter michiganensis]|uniref:NTP pyrophosphohydrolase n=1 Tax=Clavibacter michiganensis TaxID=28447 RepID=A0A251XQJ4_9MICO|nr:hypothetical protein [Clavibacter sp. MX14-G9D]OUE07559.1 hypothetical protein CMsap09_01325 [Clavibacter michiganensis]PPF51757.1 hypothetical protein C5B94_13950 [Clavibacter michiganensis]PPF67415.1 hypothetical protein C5E16_09475 [Clavibacter michiganensis]